MRLRAWLIGGAILAACVERGTAAGTEPLPKVRAERPRIYLRRAAWDGPSVERIKEWMSRPEFQARADRLPRSPRGLALLYLANGDTEAGRKAVEALKGMSIGGSSPTNWGDAAQEVACLYDWLHDHPAFDEAARQSVLAGLEKAGDRFLAYFKSPETPFYCRYSAVVAGMTTLGLAIHGDSPRADAFIGAAARQLREKFGTFRQVEDGATGGGSYGYNWEFTHLANMVSAWRSASDFDAAGWIEKNQGDWLRRQMYFQMWMTYPNGWFVKDGDIWSGSHADSRQYRMQIDTVTRLYRDGFGRSWGDEMFKRWGARDSHGDFAWQFFTFYDPTIEPRPLAGLGRAEVFSPKLHGFVCWRSSWEPDATIIHFKCGETVDHHGTYDQGKFTIFKRTPLAIKNGCYCDGYKTRHHMYMKSPWSANCVVFATAPGGSETRPSYDGMQPYLDFDGPSSWDEWQVARNRRTQRPPTGVLLSTEATENFARALGDLTGATPPGCSWTRELVFLGYTYLIVLDRVKTTAPIAHRWTLHTINEPAVEGTTVVADNAPSRLFCRTLLPAAAQLTKVGGPAHEFDYNGVNRAPTKFAGFDKEPAERQFGQWRLDVEPADGADECVYLHVLVPTSSDTTAMPPCSVERREGGLVVRVGELEYVFRESEVRSE